MAKRKSNRAARRVLGMPFHESNRHWRTVLGFSSLNSLYSNRQKSMSRRQRRAEKSWRVWLAARKDNAL